MGSLLETMANRSPLGSHEKSVTVSVNKVVSGKLVGQKADVTFKFDDLNGKILFAHSEDFQVTKNRFLRFCMSINLYAEKIALVLPVYFALILGKQ